MVKLGTKIGLSSFYCPQTDGQPKLFQRLVEQILWYIVAPSQNDWDDVLVQVEFALNVTVYSAYGQSSIQSGVWTRTLLTH